MDLIGQCVEHNSLGEGIISSFENSKITVDFESKQMDFVYPDAFKSFLTAKDETFKSYVDNETHRMEDIKIAAICKTLYIGQTLYCDNNEQVIIADILEEDIQVRYKGKLHLRPKSTIGEKLFTSQNNLVDFSREQTGKEFWPTLKDVRGSRFGEIRNRDLSKL